MLPWCLLTAAGSVSCGPLLCSTKQEGKEEASCIQKKYRAVGKRGNTAGKVEIAEVQSLYVVAVGSRSNVRAVDSSHTCVFPKQHYENERFPEAAYCLTDRIFIHKLCIWQGV